MFFAHLLQELFPQAEVYHEAGERSRLINIFTHAHLGGLLPLRAPLWAWRRSVGQDLRTCSKEIYIDSNNQIYALVSLKPDIYPGLRIIHLVRDPREYVRSHINWTRHRFKSFVANHLIPFWQPNAWLLKEMSLSKWLRLTQFERYSWIWNFKNRLIRQTEASGIPYLRIRFEDFFINPEPLSHLNQLLDFIGLESISGIQASFQQPVNPAKGKTFPAWPMWSHRQRRQLADYCGATMSEYGYGQEPEWRAGLQSPSVS
jgi:hypothetical protein